MNERACASGPLVATVATAEASRATPEPVRWRPGVRTLKLRARSAASWWGHALRYAALCLRVDHPFFMRLVIVAGMLSVELFWVLLGVIVIGAESHFFLDDWGGWLLVAFAGWAVAPPLGAWVLRAYLRR